LGYGGNVHGVLCGGKIVPNVLTTKGFIRCRFTSLHQKHRCSVVEVFRQILFHLQERGRFFGIDFAHRMKTYPAMEEDVQSLSTAQLEIKIGELETTYAEMLADWADRHILNAIREQVKEMYSELRRRVLNGGATETPHQEC